MALVKYVFGLLRRLVGLVLPLFAKARDFPGLGSAVRWTLHFLLLALVLVGLYFLQRETGLRSLLVGRTIADYWLPLLALLVYFLSWVGWYILKLLQPDEAVGHFPDIDAAWEEAVGRLNQASIDLTDVPLFLVLGRPSGGEAALFQATQMPWAVENVPSRSDAPLHVWANRDAIFVTCAGASLSGRQAGILAGEAAGDPNAPVEEMNTIGANRSIGMNSVGVADGFQEVREIMMQAQREGRTLTDEEKQRMDLLMSKGGSTGAPKPGRARRARPKLLTNLEEAANLSARLEHLCGRIARDRRPYCPLNGVLLLASYAATDADDDASQSGDVYRRDLATVRQGLRVLSPLFVLVCDLERLPGFTELVQCFPKDQRQRRVGQHFPLVPDVDPAKWPRLVEGGARWISTSLLPTLIYKFLRLEMPGRETVVDSARTNYRLVQLMGELRQREKRLGMLLTRATETDPGSPPLFGGCYLGATGADVNREQAFISGVVRRLIDNQAYVSWSQAAVDDDAAHQRWTQYGYFGLAGLVTAIVAVVGFVMLSQ
jgi:hypothetical protein